MHNLAYSLVCDSDLPRICETTTPSPYSSEAGPTAWTDEELARIRLVLRKLTSRRIENPEDAEDLVQETMLTMVQKGPGIDIEKGLLIWAMGILRKKVGNYYRKTQRLTALDDGFAPIHRAGNGFAGVPSPEANLHHRELCAMVDDFLVTLPAGERKAMDLYLTGMQTGEIVSLLAPERYQNIVNRLHRGRKKLARELAKQGYAGRGTRRKRRGRYRLRSGNETAA